MNGKKKLLIIPAANNMNFLGDIAKALQGRYDVYVNKTPCEYHDYLWLEWMDSPNLSYLSNLPFKNIDRVILRIHKYELMIERTLSQVPDIKHEYLDKLIFVSDYMKQIGVSKFKWMKKGEVISNLIDHVKFPFVNREKGYNLLYLGRIGHIKNLPYLMQLFYELLLHDSRYKLHVVGEMYDKEIYYFKENFIKKMPYFDIGKNIIFHGLVKHSEVPAIMAEMNYIVSASTFESQGIGAIEGMCAGLKPVIYNYGSADEFFQPKHLFMTRADFLKRILENDYNPREYHDFSMKNFSIRENLWRYVKAIEE